MAVIVGTKNACILLVNESEAVMVQHLCVIEKVFTRLGKMGEITSDVFFVPMMNRTNS